MATGVGLSKVWLTRLNWPTLKTPYWVHIPGLYLLRRLCYSQFCVEIRKFSLQDNMGRSEPNLTDNLKSANSYNLYWVQVSWSYILCKLSCSPVCLNSQIFVTMATGVGLSKLVWLTPLNWPTLKPSYRVQVSGSYLLRRLSYGQVCVENRNFSLP